MAVIPRLPRCGVLALAALGGRAGYLFDTRGRRIGRANLDIAFGETRTAAEKKRILKTSFETMVRTLLDTFWFAHRSGVRLEKYVSLDETSRIFFQDQAHICITAHFGNWEIIGQMSGHKQLPLHSIARPVKNETVNKHFIRAREATGQIIIPRDGALRKLLSILRKGGKTAFLADQNTTEDEGGIWVDFFGLPATVTAAPALLSVRTGAGIPVGFCVPQPGGHYRAYIAAVFKAPQQTGPETVQRLTEEITRVIEEEIRKQPQYWLWMYKRWKDRKPGTDATGYPWYTNSRVPAARRNNRETLSAS
jgi:Kdo2-lipid IVA lauroyltransferase/acyltransferase